MPFTRKSSPEREVKLGKEFPAYLPEVTKREDLERWYEDFKNLVQRNFQLIEDALARVDTTTTVETTPAPAPAAPSRWLVYDLDVAPEAAVQESKLALNYPTHSSVNDPTEKQKQALLGTHGTPSGSNKYVTNSDPRLGSGPVLAGVPVGMVLPFAGTTAPADYLECDGSELSRAVYAVLFGSIGDTWGAGDGTTTFLIPDFRGRALIGSGTGAGLTARTVGDILGEETHLLTGAESGLPAHSHEVDWRDNTCAAGSDNETGDANGAPTTTVPTSTVGPADASVPHNVIQPSAVIMWLIKYK